MKRGEIAAEAIRAEAPIVLPPGTPLFATIERAAELFGESPTTLRQLSLRRIWLIRYLSLFQNRAPRSRRLPTRAL